MYALARSQHNNRFEKITPSIPIQHFNSFFFSFFPFIITHLQRRTVVINNSSVCVCVRITYKRTHIKVRTSPTKWFFTHSNTAAFEVLVNTWCWPQLLLALEFALQSLISHGKRRIISFRVESFFPVVEEEEEVAVCRSVGYRCCLRALSSSWRVAQSDATLSFLRIHELNDGASLECMYVCMYVWWWCECLT